MQQILDILKRLEESPPQIFKFSNESTTYAIYHLNLYQNCIFQRMIELSYSAIDNIKNEKIISASTLIRTVMETFGALYYLDKEIINNLMSGNAIDATLEKLRKMIMANPLENPEVKIIHVHDFVRAVNKNFFLRYSELCELLHPNYYGVKGTYSMETFGTYKEEIKSLLPNISELLFNMLIDFEKINNCIQEKTIEIHQSSYSERIAF